MKKIGIIFLVLLLLLAASALLMFCFFPDMLSAAVPTSKFELEPKPVVAYVVKEGQSSYRIYADAKDLPAVAAAEYLSLLFLNRLGIEIPVDTVRGEGGPHIIFRAERGKDDGLPFVISLEEDGDINISLRAGEQNYGCARALMERWLSPECGLEGNTLLLNQRLIDTAFSDLSFELGGTLRILNQNLCYTDDPDGNSVVERAPRFFALVEQYNPDIITLQEVSTQWVDLLQEQYSGTYEMIGCLAYGRESTFGIGNYLLVRKERFNKLNGGVLWLSDTPEIERSLVMEDCAPRTCAWVLLEDRETGQTFYVVTTHPAAGNQIIDRMIRSMQVSYCISNVDLLYQTNGEYPMFLTGDFNIKMASEPEVYLAILEKFTNASTTALFDDSEVNYTWHNYGTRSLLLDYCFYRGEHIMILHHHIATDLYGGYVSDHYALVTDILFA